MKYLSNCVLPKPYDKDCIIVVEEFFTPDRGFNAGQRVGFAKPYKVPVDAIRNVAIGDDIEFNYNRFHKITSCYKIEK